MYRKEFLREVGARLREIRESAGVSQAECAAWIGLLQPALSKREKGLCELTAAERDVLARRFGMTEGEAFPMAEDRRPALTR
jgi:transcriptional regulator with XRE-family HTH domain